MNTLLQTMAVVAIAVASTIAGAQFVKGNEAVKVMANGKKVVETPPVPFVSLGAPCPANKAGCAGGGWKMVETDAGISECTEVFARPATCRPSTYGSEKKSRSWIVRSRGQWMQCAQPELNSKCVSLKSLPVSAFQ